MSVKFSDLHKKAEEYYPYMVDIRRHLHRNPEISYQEFDTTDYIIGKLKKLGLPVERPLETGCMAIIEGKKGKNRDRVIALRADIDALAMKETGGHKDEFISEREGAAHCCGHDAHTANLLGTARILTEYADRIEGRILLVFQPGEEKLPGGGRLLCETGFLQGQGVKEMYGLHSSPMYSPGQIATRNGPMMARPDEFTVELTGTGGHAASPHLAVDPVVMAAEAITKFQTIVSRSVDPTEPAVLTIGKVEVGTTFNIIAEKAYLEGTVRTFSQETAELISRRMEQILNGIAEGSGGSFSFHFNEGYPAVINDEALTTRFKATAAGVAGENSVIDMERPIMAGEDFAFYQQHFPGTFFLLGSGSEETGSTWSWHHPKYNVDERCFLTGAPLMSAIALGLK